MTWHDYMGTVGLVVDTGSKDEYTIIRVLKGGLLSLRHSRQLSPRRVGCQFTLFQRCIQRKETQYSTEGLPNML